MSVDAPSATEKTRNFFKLSDPIFEITDPAKMFEAMECEQKEIHGILYRPNELSGDPSSHRRQIKGKRFENVSFTRTVLRHLDFYDCEFHRCLFVSSRIENCEFHDCKFVDTNTHKIEFKGVYINPVAFDDCLSPSKHQNIGAHLYQRLMNNSHDENQPEFGRFATFNFNRWMGYQLSYEARKAWKTNRLESMKLHLASAGRKFWGVWGAGVRLRRFLLCFVVVIALFSVLNFSLRTAMGLPGVQGGLDAVYFTVITLTTIGYGDITPTEPLGKVIMAVQGFVGFFLFALAASTMFRRIAP